MRRYLLVALALVACGAPGLDDGSAATAAARIKGGMESQASAAGALSTQAAKAGATVTAVSAAAPTIAATAQVVATQAAGAAAAVKGSANMTFELAAQVARAEASTCSGFHPIRSPSNASSPSNGATPRSATVRSA